MVDFKFENLIQPVATSKWIRTDKLQSQISIAIIQMHEYIIKRWREEEEKKQKKLKQLQLRRQPSTRNQGHTSHYRCAKKRETDRKSGRKMTIQACSRLIVTLFDGFDIWKDLFDLQVSASRHPTSSQSFQEDRAVKLN